MKRYFLPLVAAVVMLTFVVTACTPTPTTAPASTSGGAPAGTTQWIPLTGPLAGACSQQVTLRFLGYAGSPFDAAHKAMIEEFQKQYPNCKIQHEMVPFAELYRKILTEIAAASPPDIIYADGPAVSGYAAAGALLALDPFVPEEDRKDFYPSSLEEGMWQGKIYGLASEQSAHLVYYRLDAATEAGIKPPDKLENGWKWPEAREAAKKMTVIPPGGGVPTRFGFARFFGQYTLAAALRSAGDPKAPQDSSAYKAYAGISADGKTVKGYQDAPEVIAAMKFFQEMWKEGSAAKDNIPDAMPTGKAAMWIGAEWAEGTLLSRFKDLKWSVTPMPYFKTPTVHNGSFAYTVSAKTKHQKEAVLFARWMTSPEAEKLQFKYNPQIPARRSVARALDAYKTFPKALTLQSFEQHGVTRIRTPVFPQYDTLLNEAGTNVIAGADVEKEWKLFADKLQQTLDQFWAGRK